MAYLVDNGHLSLMTNKNIISNSQDRTAVLPTQHKVPTPEQPGIEPRTPVQRLMNGDWQDGWIVRDGSNIDAITVERLGNPNLTVRNLRWTLDLRPVPPKADDPIVHDSTLPF